MIEFICEGLKSESLEKCLYLTVNKTRLATNYKIEMNNYLKSKLNETKPIVIDISQLEIAGSDIMNTIVICKKYMGDKNKINIVVKPKSELEEELQMVGFTQIFNIFYTKESLMKYLN